MNKAYTSLLSENLGENLAVAVLPRPDMGTAHTGCPFAADLLLMLNNTMTFFERCENSRIS